MNTIAVNSTVEIKPVTPEMKRLIEALRPLDTVRRWRDNGFDVEMIDVEAGNVWRSHPRNDALCRALKAIDPASGVADAARSRELIAEGLRLIAHYGY